MTKGRKRKGKRKGRSKKPKEEDLTRRTFIKTCAAAGGAGFVAAAGFGTYRSLFVGESGGEQEASNAFVFFASAEEKAASKLWYIPKLGEEATETDFEPGQGANLIWRETIPAIMIMLDKKDVKDPTDMIETPDGNFIVAYFSKCTHLCCIVSWKKDKPDLNGIFCPCHDAIFDAGDNGKVTQGPPPSPLVKIPIVVEDGKIMGLPTRLGEYLFCGG